MSTVERWYYAARGANDPVAALKNRLRDDVSRFPSLLPEVIEALTLQYREHPGWTVQLHFDNLCAARKMSDTAMVSYPTIRRYMKAQGMFRQAQPKRATAGALAARDRLERLEVRSFEVDHVCALWHLDFHHGSRKILTRGGEWMTPMLMCVIDDRSRLVCHLQWYFDETAESLIHSLCQAFMKRAPATRPDDRQRRRHAGRGNDHRLSRTGRATPDDAPLFSVPKRQTGIILGTG